MSKRNREAGHRFERTRAKTWRELGWSECETTRAAAPGLDKKGIDLVGTDPFVEQDKYTKNAPNLYKILKEMPEQKGKYNIVAHKRPADREATVTILESDWNELMLMLKGNKII